MHHIFIIAALVSLVPVAKSFAQKPTQGFVITTQGDTIRGELFRSDKDARKQLVHLKTPFQPVTTYSAADIRGFGRPGRPLVESKTYASQTTPILVEALVKGPVSLYRGYTAVTQDLKPNTLYEPNIDYAPDVRYYLQLPDSAQMLLIKSEPLVLSLARLMGDCASIDFTQRTSQRNRNYNTKFLKSLVEDYSTCRFSTEPTSTAEPYSGWHTSWGVKAGINRVQLKTGTSFYNLPQAKSEFASSWQGGVFGNLAYWNGLSVQLEVLLVNLEGNFKQSVYSGTTLYSVSREANFQIRQLQLPLLLRYQVGRSLIRPFFTAGPHFGYELSHSTVITDKRSDRPNADSRNVRWPDALIFGLQGGAGLYLALPDLPGISLEAVYSQGQQGSEINNSVGYTNLALGIAAYF